MRLAAPAIATRTRAETTTTPEIDVDILRRLLPPWNVVLHNDDHNPMDHVVISLIRSVPSLSPERAAEIMLLAHNHGQATVITCVKEEAELYRERLESCGLTATIEPD
ncbi:MAG: ATP-dependent Clp protease adaptor ClpS [Dehalococcoidia bacterium]